MKKLLAVGSRIPGGSDLTNRNGSANPGASGSGDSERRDRASDERDQAGDQRDQAAEQRDQAADDRDKAAGQRDAVAGQRDAAAGQRDQAGDERDRAGERRDQAADRRDRAAENAEASVSTEVPRDVLNRSALSRQEAATDRSRASQDRVAGASERTEAESDRNAALADRGASAKERESSSLDGLTGAYLRGPGSVELSREIVRARRAEQPLTLAFVDVDGLKAINDSRGHAAGDRVLLDVANALRAMLRSHDLIIRYGGDEFACVIAGLNAGHATKRLDLVHAALAEGAVPASVSVGVAELQPDDSTEDLLARADAALYRERSKPRRTFP